jgi:hypothetical protein
MTTDDEAPKSGELIDPVEAERLDALARSAELFLDGFKQWRRSVEDSVEGQLKMATALVGGRRQCKSDQEFNRWCKANGFGGEVLNKNDRMALLHFGADLERARRVLEKSDRKSPRLIYENEWKEGFAAYADPQSRFPASGKPARGRPPGLPSPSKKAPAAVPGDPILDLKARIVRAFGGGDVLTPYQIASRLTAAVSNVDKALDALIIEGRASRLADGRFPIKSESAPILSLSKGEAESTTTPESAIDSTITPTIVGETESAPSEVLFSEDALESIPIADPIGETLVANCADGQWRSLAELANRIGVPSPKVKEALHRLGGQCHSVGPPGGRVSYKILTRAEAEAYARMGQEALERSVKAPASAPEMEPDPIDKVADHPPQTERDEAQDEAQEEAQEQEEAVIEGLSAEIDAEVEQRAGAVFEGLSAEIAALKAERDKALAEIERLKAEHAAELAKSSPWAAVIQGGESGLDVRQRTYVVIAAAYVAAAERLRSIREPSEAHAMEDKADVLLAALTKREAESAIVETLAAELTKRLGFEIKRPPNTGRIRRLKPANEEN